MLKELNFFSCFLLCLTQSLTSVPLMYADAYDQFSEYTKAQKVKYVQQFVLKGNNLTLVEEDAN